MTLCIFDLLYPSRERKAIRRNKNIYVNGWREYEARKSLPSALTTKEYEEERKQDAQELGL